MIAMTVTVVVITFVCMFCCVVADALLFSCGRWVLDQPAVGSVIVGTRIGYVTHQEANKNVLRLSLTNSDRENIMSAYNNGHGRGALRKAFGDVGGEYKGVLNYRPKAPVVTKAWGEMDEKGFMPQSIVDLGAEVL